VEGEFEKYEKFVESTFDKEIQSASISAVSGFGRDHPPVCSAKPQPDPAAAVGICLGGAVTPTSAWITAKLLNESSAVRLVVSRRVDLSDPIFSDFYFPPTVFDLS
jgi:hypothetical protein